MTIQVIRNSQHVPEYTAKSDDGSEGYGTSPDEALGHCVRELFLANAGRVVIHEIIGEDESAV
mgnify:CR=1 FL=1